VLGDLIDANALLRAGGWRARPEIDDAIESMRRWLGIMLMPDGDVPLFNDCSLVGVDRIDLLKPTPRTPDRLVVLRETGYAVMRPDDRIHLVADVGNPCPPDLPAHAHADCLSFELAVDGDRVIVDPGVSTYEPGPQRDWERSTAAHNTIEIDGRNQTEIWGAFRAGRLAQVHMSDAREHGDGTIRLTASHDGYEHLPGAPRHKRTFIASAGAVTIQDEVTGRGVHRIALTLNLVSSQVERLQSCTDLKDVTVVVTSTIGELKWSEDGAKAFGGRGVPGRQPASLSSEARLPVSCRTEIRRRST
jgi:uncharacterized heparinase superfamily protein